MNIVTVDDEKLILDDMIAELNIVYEDQEIRGFEDAIGAVHYAEDLKAHGDTLDYAFLDINLRGESGIDLARKIKEIQPDARIIFCTSYSEYALEAYKLHAVGYLLKPVSANDIIETLDAFDKKWREGDSVEAKEVRVQTFGNFDVFVNGEAVIFQREKAKELFAYLIDKNGTGISTAEVISVLWENRTEDKSIINQAHTVISSLKKTFKDLGCGNIIVKGWNRLSVDTRKIKCDVYDFYKGDVLAINSYRGEYMAQYSWAEMTNADLAEKSSNKWFGGLK